MKFTTIGGATVDIIVHHAADEFELGAKHEVRHIGLYAGGGAMNAAFSFALHGAEVRVINAVGSDVEGQWLKKALIDKGIDASAMQVVDGARTGKAVIHVMADGNATVFVQRGAGAALRLDTGVLSKPHCDAVYVTALGEQPTEQLASTLSAMGEAKPYVVINPGARQLKGFRPLLMPLLDMADLICLNAIEAQVLADVPKEQLSEQYSFEQTSALIPRLVRRARQCILITLGADGAVFYDGQTCHVGQPANVNLVSTVGAGDAFNSAFVCEWLTSGSASQAFEYARRYVSRVLAVPPANLAGPLADMQQPAGSNMQIPGKSIG